MRTLSVSFLFLFFCSFCFQKDSAKTDFEKICSEDSLIFTLPAGFNEVPVKENRDLFYNYAIKKSDKKFEVRYSIFPLAGDFEEYRKCKLDSSHCIMINPNNIGYGRAEANVLNMSGGVSYNIVGFDSAAVRKEFSADAGGTCFMQMNCKYGEGYKFGQMIFIHKDNVADVIIMYLSDKKEGFSDLMMEAFYSLKFKN